MNLARPVLAAWLGAAVAIAAAPAVAQPAAKDPPGAPEGDPAPPTPADADDAPPDERAMEGVEENPGAPRPVGEPEPEAAPPPPTRRLGYPIEEALRPITLPATMAEVGIDLRGTIDPVFGGTLRGRYGITRQAQIGLRYGLGAAFDPPGDEGFTFKTGKAIAVDAAYLVFDWVAIQVSLPIYLDPFAMGLVLGAPVKFRFGDKLALFAAQDLVEIKLHEFVPSLVSEAANVAAAADREINTELDDGTFRFSGGAIVQLESDLALIGYLAVELRDFQSQDPGYQLHLTAQKSLSPRFDLAGRIGFDDLGNADDTFGVQLTAQLRI